MARKVRTKVFEMDGAEFTIAPLTLDQVDEYVAPLSLVAVQKDFGFKKAFQVICFGLNNALPENVDQSEIWTEDRVKSEIDLVLFERLQNAILEFSGFKLNKPVPEKVGIPGEQLATSETVSSLNVPEGTDHSLPLSVMPVVA